MARLPRFELLGHPQHVIVRGNNRQIIFVADEVMFSIWKNWQKRVSDMAV